jgi:hypothetical protein
MTHRRTDSFFEHDASLNLHLAVEPYKQRIAHARDEVLDHLRSRGFVIGLCPKTLRDYTSLSQDHHRGVKGHLHVRLSLAGCQLELKFFQELVKENRHGGEFDFQQRSKMPYLVGKQYELERGKIAALMHRLGLPELRLDVLLKGIDYIRHRRAELEAFQGAGFYDPKRQQDYNRRSASGTLLSDGDRVTFRDEFTGRQWVGIAYANINSMWWVLLPGGVVRNIGCNRLLMATGDAWPGRTFPQARVEARLRTALRSAVAQQRFERAAVLRDVIAARYGAAERIAA